MSAATPRLTTTALATLDPSIGSPSYDRDKIAAGIVHIGVGGFHRAHMAMTIDRLLEQGKATDWGICGVGLLETDRRMKTVLEEQDHLYTLTVRRADGGEETAVIGSIVDYLFAPDDRDAVIERMAAPETRIVSLTITEGGYNIDQITGEFDLSTPAVAADIAGDVPTTAFGFVVEALRRRRERGVPPFTVLSCDNVQGNGDVAARVIAAFATARDPELGAWIRSEVSFPSSMVDRITPGTTPEDVRSVAARTGVRDEWPVVCEPFFQWVIEDDFPLGRPPFEEADVQMVEDVEPYELMKLRLLNASHQGLCYFAHLMGYRLVHDAAADPLIAEFLRRYMDLEGTPTLRAVPGVDLDDYKRTLIARFANPAVRDTVARLCADSSNRIPKWLVPVVREQARTGGSVAYAAAIIASWARYAEGVGEDGAPIDVVDALADELTPLARSQREHPLAFLEKRSLFGDLVDDDRFAASYRAALDDLHGLGARATLERLLEGTR
ncbi:mannitol dehydrogenase family protein [Microbacterium karelineae]|uniref:mannitol dehydrogenase family protein n=1 Tax=Microbacterium karelineae TaxID=2654283 RepID=UPI0018D47A96|nr:mannitol dehydrogenase family protein [Microbacterium karelineae]